MRAASWGKYYFLSRPRRFGKSLLADTLQELGSEELFRGLAVHGGWDWSARRRADQLRRRQLPGPRGTAAGGDGEARRHRTGIRSRRSTSTAPPGRWGKLRPDCENAVRVASLFGTAGASGKGGNFVETIAGKEKGALRAVDDQTMSPTAAAARVVLRILASGCVPYHAVNDGAATWSPAKSSASPEPS